MSILVYRVNSELIIDNQPMHNLIAEFRFKDEAIEYCTYQNVRFSETNIRYEWYEKEEK